MKILAIPKVSIIPEEEKTPAVIQLLEIVQVLADVIQILKEEISRVKGQKGKPTIKPSALENSKNDEEKKKTRERDQIKILEPSYGMAGMFVGFGN